MDLTPELKANIDSRTYIELLAKWRSAPIGDPMFQGESGEYYSKRMAEVRDNTPHEEQVRASKEIG